MTEPPDVPEPPSGRPIPALSAPVIAAARRSLFSPGLKFFLLGVLTLLLLIPLVMVSAIVGERESNFRAATAEIGLQWGGRQTVTGPLVLVPVIVDRPAVNAGELPRRTEELVALAPDTLHFDAATTTQTLTRGIYDAVVYQAKLTGRATFSGPDLAGLSGRIVSVDWSRARLAMSLGDLKGVEAVTIRRGEAELAGLEPGFGPLYPVPVLTGFSVPVDLSRDFAGLRPVDGPDPREPSDAAMGERGVVSFDLDIALKGSQEIQFAPSGDVTTVAMTSGWPHPSFAGSFLPASREIAADGFTASWSVPKLARSIPHLAFAAPETFDTQYAFAFGVRFYQPVDFYRQVQRAVKYGVVFIGVAFVLVFGIELLAKGRMHPVQYVMAGMMIVVFYTLLLALAEFVGFELAYAIAAGATGAVLSAFVAAQFPGRTWAMAAFAGFATLYGALYAILRLEDAALLAGAITGFLLLTVLMFATRKVDWSGRNA